MPQTPLHAGALPPQSTETNPSPPAPPPSAPAAHRPFACSAFALSPPRVSRASLFVLRLSWLVHTGYPLPVESRTPGPSSGLLLSLLDVSVFPPCLVFWRHTPRGRVLSLAQSSSCPLAPVCVPLLAWMLLLSLPHSILLRTPSLSVSLILLSLTPLATVHRSDHCRLPQTSLHLPVSSRRPFRFTNSLHICHSAYFSGPSTTPSHPCPPVFQADSPQDRPLIRPRLRPYSALLIFFTIFGTNQYPALLATYPWLLPLRPLRLTQPARNSYTTNSTHLFLCTIRSLCQKESELTQVHI